MDQRVRVAAQPLFEVSLRERPLRQPGTARTASKTLPRPWGKTKRVVVGHTLTLPSCVTQCHQPSWQPDPQRRPDDVIVHARSESQARYLRDVIARVASDDHYGKRFLSQSELSRMAVRPSTGPPYSGFLADVGRDDARLELEPGSGRAG
jgi:hypothetical protein